MQNICKICSSQFETVLAFTKYCSKSCRTEARRLESERHTRSCPKCGKMFASHSRTRPIHCSVSCGAKRHDYDGDTAISMIESGVAIREMSSELRVPTTALAAYAARHGITETSVRYAKKLTDFQVSMIRGGMLGDSHASMTPSGKFRLKFRHGPEQYRYLDWKFEQLRDIVRTAPKTTITEGAYGEEARTFTTITNLTVSSIAREIYRDGVRVVTKSYLDKLDTIGLAVWFMDDGHIRKNGGNLSTHCFSVSESRLIALWLSNRYSTHEPRLSLDKRCGKYSIAIHTRLAEAIAAEIKVIVDLVPGMSYKTSWYRGEL